MKQIISQMVMVNKQTVACQTEVWYQMNLILMITWVFVNQMKTASLQLIVAQFSVVEILRFAFKATNSTVMFAILVLSACQDAAYWASALTFLIAT